MVHVLLVGEGHVVRQRLVVAHVDQLDRQPRQDIAEAGQPRDAVDADHAGQDKAQVDGGGETVVQPYLAAQLDQDVEQGQLKGLLP